MDQTVAQMPVCAPVAFLLFGAVLGNTSRSKSNPGVHLQLQGCATTPASQAVGSITTATHEQGRESGFHLQLTKMHQPAPPFHPPCVRAHCNQQGTAQMALVKNVSPASPLSPEHQARVEIVCLRLL